MVENFESEPEQETSGEEVESVEQEEDTDYWKYEKQFLTPFRPEGCNPEKLARIETELEENRLSHLRNLMAYAMENGYSFHKNYTPGKAHIWGANFGGFGGQEAGIVFPTHIMPEEARESDNLVLRRDIPALYHLSSFAHEITHLDRWHNGDPKTQNTMRRMYEEGYMETPETYNVGEFGNEEIATDVQAYFLLKELGVPIEPENYVSYVGRGSSYQEHVYSGIREQLGRDE